jgi:hypothetical protein
MEGSAVYADNQCHIENPIPAINAYYLLKNQLLPVDSLIHHFDLVAQKNDVVAYLQSAGFFKYLYEKYGPGKMKVLWTSGFENVQDLFGKELVKLEEEYREYLKQIPVPADFQESMIEKGCG